MNYSFGNIFLFFLLTCFSNRLCHCPSEQTSRLFLFRCYRPSWSFSGPGIRTAFLPSDREPLAMTQPPVRAYIHESLDRHGDFSSQVSLDLYILVDNAADR